MNDGPQVIAKAKEMGAFHQYFQSNSSRTSIPSGENEDDRIFDELFDKATSKLQKLNDEPERIRRLGGD